MIKKPDVLSEKEIINIAQYSNKVYREHLKECPDRVKVLRRLMQLHTVAQAQLDVCAKHYEPLIKDMYEALLYIKGLMERHIYKDADVVEFGGSKLSIEGEIVKVLAKVEGK